MLDDDTINKNTAGIKAILERVLANGALDAGADVPAAKVFYREFIGLPMLKSANMKPS